MARSMTELFKNFTGAAGSVSPQVKITDYGGPLRDCTYSAYVWATNFGGGTVRIEVTPDGGASWFGARRVTTENQADFTVSDMQMIYLKGTHARAVVNGGTGVVGLNVGFCL